MMWVDVRAVVRREYLQRVRSRWFVASTLFAPLFLFAVLVLPSWFTSRDEPEDRTLAVVDGTGVLYERLAPLLEDAGYEVREQRWHADVVTELRREAAAGLVSGFLMVDELTLETGEAILYTRRPPDPLRRAALRGSVVRAALEFQLAQQDVDVDALLAGGDLEVEPLGSAGADREEPRFLVAYVGSFLLYMVILIYAIAVMRATLEEKTSRIVEVIVSSMDPWHLMLGKIVGVGAVSLTQLTIWLALGVLLVASGLPMVVAADSGLADLTRVAGVLPDAGMIALFVGFFVFGFFMYSGLYAAVGAMCNSDEEAQQAQLPVILFIVVPILMVVGVIEDPSSNLSVGLSLFPLFTPILMWARIAGGSVPPLEIALSFVLMALATLGIAWVAGRIYKVGILMAGKRPTLPELWRWIREA